jgi:predicted transglutaminase-like cysteine proteinase
MSRPGYHDVHRCDLQSLKLEIGNGVNRRTRGAINALPVGSEQLAHVLVSGAARPPLGWVEFSARQPGECAETTTAPRDLALSRKAWIYLVRVNNWVNETITPLSG